MFCLNIFVIESFTSMDILLLRVPCQKTLAAMSSLFVAFLKSSIEFL